MQHFTPRTIAILAAAFATVSIAYAIRYGFGMLLPGMQSALHLTHAQGGLISSVYFIAYTLFSPVLGFLADRYDSRLLLTLFPLLLAAGALLMAFAATLSQSVLFFALAGIGHAACWTPVVSLVQQWAPDRYRGLALSVATLGSSVGIAAWSLWLPVVVARSDYRQGWLQMGIFAAIVAVANFFLIRDAPTTQAAKKAFAEQPPAVTRSMYRQLLTSPALWLIGLSYAGIGFVVLVPFTFLAVYATQELHLSYAMATRFFTVLAVAGIAGKLLLGTLSDRLGRVPVMMACSLLLATGCWGFVLFNGLPGKYGSAVCAGLGFGGVWPVYAAAAMDYFPRTQAGRTLGLWTVFLGVGSILSPILCGWTIDTTGQHANAFILGAVVAVLATALLVPLAGGRYLVKTA